MDSSIKGIFVRPIQTHFLIVNCIHLTSRDIGSGACGGVSVLVRDGIPYSECMLITTLQAKSVIISTS